MAKVADKETAHLVGRPLFQNWIKTPYDLVNVLHSHHQEHRTLEKVQELRTFFFRGCCKEVNQTYSFS